MWEFILFIRDKIADLTSLLNSYNFNIAGMSISLLDMIIGLIAMGIVIAVFWKGART